MSETGAPNVGPPSNLHRRSALEGPRSLSQRMEQKFFIAPRRINLVLALLLRRCRWAVEYPEEQINSLYFDTIDLDQHQRSSAGEFAKDKVRIRWYGSKCDPHGGPLAPEDAVGPHSMAGPGESTVPVWLELKSRRGASSTKLRRVVEVQETALVPGRLAAGIVPADTLLQTIAEFGFFSKGSLRPVVVVSYWRRRFIEPQTGARVALDSHIRSSCVMSGVGRGEKGLELPGAIVELKAPKLDLPQCLRPLAEIGSSWTRYSKYSSSLEAHMSTLGAVSRLWPSGTMEG